ncbi:Rieske 2Fe-2S domain-containing protein [Thermus thermamylovorans]|uniref:Ubiquinol-cytochrome c reductase iron-sulfur subunit n=1 Tax=Thermus thermamylovorans TaxID=2509362 RepID=A0A4Q9AWR6_9DEIN|nr:Rieske 2Fe-2S domain-containing protein [Thermus thermamylovorans]TBH15337.1 ubiquinol-cytochrome c reductase iron-sulfur subunit [Thermus thermamylovorans]
MRGGKKNLRRRDLVFYLPVAVAGGFFLWFGVRVYNLGLRERPRPGEPVWREGPRVAVVRRGELGLWEARPFEYPLAQGPLRAFLLRLPAPAPGGLSLGEEHYIALSRICTHQFCTLNYVPDPEAGSLLYNFRHKRPFLGCPCHFGAFDPLLGGKAVYGPPRHPLPRLRLEVEGETLLATGHEVPLRPLEGGRAPCGRSEA